jgi:hypothetical protein
VSCNGSAGLLGREVRLESLGASADTAKLSGRNVKVAVKLPASWGTTPSRFTYSYVKDQNRGEYLIHYTFNTYCHVVCCSGGL